MKYTLYLLPSAEKDCDRLPLQIYQRCYKSMQRLVDNPRPVGSQKLVGEEGYRIHIGDYRILYRIEEPSKAVYIYRVKHRKEVYR